MGPLVATPENLDPSLRAAFPQISPCCVHWLVSIQQLLSLLLAALVAQLFRQLSEAP